MEILITRLENERVQYRQLMHRELEAQRVQMQNMMAANMKQAEQEREAFIKDNQALEERFLETSRARKRGLHKGQPSPRGALSGSAKIERRKHETDKKYDRFNFKAA